MSGLKVGDFAITKIDLAPFMAGTVVELIERIVEGDLVPTPGGVLQAKVNGWICAHPKAPGNLGFCDSALMPLRDDFEQKQEEVREAAL